MNVLARPFLYFTLTYLLTIGATFNGVLMPNVRLLSAALLGIITAGWVVTKLRSRWTAHRTALDTAFVLWAAAFLLSTLGNLDLWHRIRVGLWFVGVYIAAWYLLHDLIAQRPSLRRAAADVLLIAGGLALLIGFAQVQGWFAALPSAIAQGLPVILPRPGSIIGNPNALAALLVITLPLAAVRLAERKPLIRVLMAVYCAGAITLIALTFSRGAWIGAVAAVCVTVALSLARLDPRQVWRSASQGRRRLIISMAAVALLMFTVFAIYLVQSLDQVGRGAALRTYLWDAALGMMGGSPLSGVGLYTFGHELARYSSIPPQQAQAHAHNFILHVAAELGLPGVLALIFTVTMGGRGWLRNWRAVSAPEHASDRRLLIGATAGGTGFLIHHLFDIPAMMPAIALGGLIVLTLALAPFKPVPAERSVWRGVSVLVSALSIILVVTSLIAGVRYNSYVSALTDGVRSGEYAQAADALNDQLAADPDGVALQTQRGMLFALAGETERARAAYEAALEAEPLWAFAWANAGMLALTAGDAPLAQAYLTEAVLIAPDEAWLHYWRSAAAESAGDELTAEAAAEAALQRNPHLRYLPEWDTSQIRAAAAESLSPDLAASGARLFTTVESAVAGRAAAARAAWGSNSMSGAVSAAISALVSASEGDADAAQRHLRAAQMQAGTPSDSAWTLYAETFIWQAQHNAAASRRAWDTLIAGLSPGAIAADWESGANIYYLQLLTTGIPRMFVPQAGYTPVDPLLLAIVAQYPLTGS